MKLLKFTLIFFLFVSCASNNYALQKDEDGDGIPDKDDQDPTINNYFLFSDFNKELKSIVGDDNPVPDGEPKLIEDELYKLFNPDSFDCGCDIKLKKNISKFNNEKGYIPKEIKESITGLTGNHLPGRGSNNLLNSFQIKGQDGKVSSRFFVKSSPTAINYDVLNYLIVIPDTYDNLYYSIDCSGYLTGVISAGIGINENSVKTSSNNVIDKKKSLVIIKGVLDSPLNQAIKGHLVFKEDKALRKQVLQALVDRVPTEYNDESEIIINENYEVFLTSNSGNASFNGKIDVSASVGYNFILGNANSSASANGNVGRVSNFSRFNTYILSRNIDGSPVTIKLKTLKNLLASL